MTPQQLDLALCAIDWSNGRLAGQLACDEKLVRQWLAGTAPVPAPVAHWLRQLAAAHKALPAPSAWRVPAAQARLKRIAALRRVSV